VYSDEELGQLAPSVVGSRERLTIPVWPSRFPTQSAFGDEGIRWGSGDAEALDRMNAITLEELKSLWITLQMAIEWTAFYANEALRTPRNPSARGRAMLMHRAAILLGGKND
jgi:hypothetical protein